MRLLKKYSLELSKYYAHSILSLKEDEESIAFSARECRNGSLPDRLITFCCRDMLDYRF
jgi:hypothetical protein